MPDTMFKKLSLWNERMNGLPRKGMLIAATLLCAWLVVLLFPYCWPFVIALCFSLMLEPFVRFVSSRCKKLRIGRSLATMVGMLVLFGLFGIMFFTVVNRLARELMGLAQSVPEFLRWLKDVALPWLNNLYEQYKDIWPAFVMDIVDKAVAGLGENLLRFAGTVSASVTTGAWSTAMSIPNVLLSIVLTIMGTFYITADKGRISAFFRRTFPRDFRQQSGEIKANLLKAMFGQFKSQIAVSLIITTFMVLALVIYGTRYGLLIGLIIGIADALPVVGAGLFLIPWCILSFIVGDVTTGIFMACLYVGTIIIRQIFEPRIVGKNLGLYPLTTMIAMYAGYQLMGFLGLLAGPILLNILKVVLEADDSARARALADTPAEEIAQAEDDGTRKITLPNGKRIPIRIRSKRK